jgi:hypothetical protein
MQVDKQPSPVNLIGFNGKKTIVWSDATDKDKEKSIIIDDPRALDENIKIFFQRSCGRKDPRWRRNNKNHYQDRLH